MLTNYGCRAVTYPCTFCGCIWGDWEYESRHNSLIHIYVSEFSDNSDYAAANCQSSNWEGIRRVSIFINTAEEPSAVGNMGRVYIWT